MTYFANSHIRALEPYVPPLDGRQDYLCLDFNERTVPLPQTILDAINRIALNAYPDYSGLCDALANYAQVKVNQVMITNGSSQGIDLIFRTFTQFGDKVIIPVPSFAMYQQYAGIVGNTIISPSYDVNGRFPFDEVMDALDASIKLLVLCNPNNPTGTLIPFDQIERMIQKAFECGVFVYVDEAYFEFSNVTAMKLVDRYPNLFITRTFSKAFGISALRIGYLVSNPSNINEMLKVRGPYDINMVAAVLAQASLQFLDDIGVYISEVMKQAKPLLESFFREKEIPFFPSAANFLLFRPLDSKLVFERLKENGILTRPRSGINIEGTIRVTIGTVEQIERFLSVYKTFIF